MSGSSGLQKKALSALAFGLRRSPRHTQVNNESERPQNTIDEDVSRGFENIASPSESTPLSDPSEYSQCVKLSITFKQMNIYKI